jgi:superfamily II DNA or RNA helicase
VERYLSQQVAKAFGPEVRNRGERLLRRAVTIIESEPDRIVADIRGSRLYLVSVTLQGTDLAIDCTCPFYESYEPCKHIWSLIRAAENNGLLPAAKDLALGLVDAEMLSHYGAEPEHSHFRYLSPPPPEWRQALTEMRPRTPILADDRGTEWPLAREIFYILDTSPDRLSRLPVLNVSYRDKKVRGKFTALKPLSLEIRRIATLRDPLDREILALLCGADEAVMVRSDWLDVPHSVQLPPLLAPLLFKRMSETGRFLQSDYSPISIDEGPPWEPSIAFERDEESWKATASLAREQERIPLTGAAMIAKGGWVLVGDRLGRFAEHYSQEILSSMRSRESIHIKDEDIDAFLAELFLQPGLPALVLPGELQVEEIRAEPEPIFRVQPAREGSRELAGGLWFQYQDALFQATSPAEARYLPEARKLVRRDLSWERQARDSLAPLPLRSLPGYLQSEGMEWEISQKALPTVVWALTSRGWTVEGQGAIYRRPMEPHLSVTSGIDWFEVGGAVDFGTVKASLPELLKALKRGETTVILGDGSIGLIPEEWMSRFGLLAATANTDGDVLRFRKSQALLLDALLAAQPVVNVDAAFGRIREQLKTFAGIRPADQPEGFHGVLRDYQREGLAWFHFLEQFSLGGCLADDMGVGKTIQVLALLEERRQQAANANAPSPQTLVVAPKSVIFNWRQETARFTPNLKVHEYAGPGRSLADAADADLVLTTYGTLRRDIVKLQGRHFDYAVLDEAQNIKNPGTATAKAARLLNADHRLALTGTPVENHLGELWSIFEFLNPGMLGASSLWHSTSGAVSELDDQTRDTLHHALSPYILRRTKAQVAPELPERLEQTIYCEFEPAQRRKYDELRDHYRNALLGRIDNVGLSRSKMQILEALLRLRQAACHPALLDKERISAASAKFDALIPMLEEIIEEGHKALIFSQFTSLLALLRPKLEKRHWDYEYLDGKTRDRESRVGRFQAEPGCHLFLISLKAGGLGLNLTAADYVFLLDPWWNPAVEAQAIDRAHRIGQTRNVFAYRLIARDTVEEKVLELQKTKRALADAIITENNSLLRNIRPEDLRLLLS